MSNHLGDTNKKVSETPRTDARRGFHGLDTAVDAEFSEQIELELNAAHDRIKRLEEAGDSMDKSAEPFILTSINEGWDEGPMPMSQVSEQYEITYDSPPTAGEHVAIERARKEWRKAKEAKL